MSDHLTVTIIDEKKEKIIYKNNWITNHQIQEKNVDKIVKAGRSGWKIENEGNNVLKNHGYNLECHFGLTGWQDYLLLKNYKVGYNFN